MRPDAPGAAQIVLDLLARADVLAVEATAAIESGDEAQLAAVLDDRDAVISAIQRTWRDAAHTTLPEQHARVTQATRASLALGLAARNTAQVARDQVVAALSALDARLLASHEYHLGTPHGTIDVVL